MCFLFAHCCSTLLNQHKSGHFRLTLVQRPCPNTTQLVGAPYQSLPAVAFFVILLLLWAKEGLLYALVLSKHMAGNWSVI